MARIRQIRFPAVQFNRAGAPILIPGSEISDTFGDGLIVAVAFLNCRATAIGNLRVELAEDGASLGSTAFFDHGAPTIDFHALCPVWTLPPRPGTHRYSIFAGTRTAGTFTLDDGSGKLTIFELPDWTDRPGAFVL